MKKRLFLFPALLAVLLLSGCTRELNGAGLALSFPEETVQFTGTFSGGAAVRGEYTKAKIAATASTSAAPEANLLCRERKPPNFPIIIVLSPLADIL